ncbi:MAG: Tn3 family transposase [Legionella sp.]|nr:Tn3 family transposase [Legionella sp.]
MYSPDRIQLLSDEEIDAIYGIPTFNDTERALYFDLNETEKALSKKYRTIKSKIYFIRMLGYFKAKQQLYRADLLESNPKDTQYIMAKYFDVSVSLTHGEIDKKTYGKMKTDLLVAFGYQDWSIQLMSTIQSNIGELLKIHPKIHDALRHLLIYFDSHQILLPSYRTLQDLFTTAISKEENRLNDLITNLPAAQKGQLSALIEQTEGITDLNNIRADQKNFQYTSVQNSIDKIQKTTELYDFSKEFIPTLQLSKNAIRYYADLTVQYPPARLRRLSQYKQWLQMLCFVHYRYQQIMDELIISFMYHVKLVLSDGKTAANEAYLKNKVNVANELPKLGIFLQWFPERDPLLAYEEVNKMAYDILPKEKFPLIVDFLKSLYFDKEAVEWEHYEKSSQYSALNIRPILLHVPFVYYKDNSQLTRMMNFLKNHYSSGKGPIDLHLPEDIKNMLSKRTLQYLKANPSDLTVDPHRFEFFVYKKMCHQLERGRLCCNESVSFSDIDHELVSVDVVENVDEIALRFGFHKIPIYCGERLDQILALLDEAWDRVPGNIQSGKNQGFKIKDTKKKAWTLLYDTSEKLEDAFFKKLPKVAVADVLTFMGGHSHFWNAFTHMKDRYTKKKKPHLLSLTACIIARAFGLDPGKMAEMSDLNFNLLRATDEDLIRMDTLCGANDENSNYINTLPIFRLWNLIDDKLLADVDGQKFSTNNKTIQSRFSTKYVGKGKGISLYTLLANFIAVNARNIGINEYEGHFLYDMIYSNKSDIEINMVTGDNHSKNQLNYVVLDSIDVDYVPCIKNIREAANDLYSVKSPSYYTGILKPKAAINVELIRSEKKNIIRVLLSLLMQENTQSNIIRKINSHTRYARLRLALFEYNKIFKSIHILNLIDDMSFRKALRTARNRTEAYHQLQGIIRKVYRGIFKGKTITDNRVSAHAARLLANSIIGYNSIILNNIYEKMVAEGVPDEVIEEFARISPIAWAHILFTGRYRFKGNNGLIDIAGIVQILEDQLKQSIWKEGERAVA